MYIGLSTTTFIHNSDAVGATLYDRHIRGLTGEVDIRAYCIAQYLMALPGESEDPA